MPPREILPGLIRLTLPLPFDLKWVHVHLLRLPGDVGWMLIDTGFANETCENALRRGLEAVGVRVSDIRQIVLTHGHPDHLGLAAKLERETGAELMLHPAEQEFLAEIDGSVDKQIVELLEAAGVPREQAIPTRDSFVEVRRAFRPFPRAKMLKGGARLETALGPLEAIWTPGHAPGHLCLHLPEQRLLIAGDHVLPAITPIISWDPAVDYLALYLDSLAKVETVDAGLTSPSHGETIDDHRRRAGEIREHHVVRCGVIRGAIASGEPSAHEIVPKLWARTLSPFNYRFALDEVLAHLEYMKGRDEVECRPVNGALRWRPRIETGAA